MTTLVLGIDTSAYTTSLAVMTPTGQLRRDVRRILDVPRGQRGLRQSEAVYQHVHNLPAVFTDAWQDLSPINIGAVCTSTAPRPVDHSFMPVFTAGYGTAQAVATTSGVPLWQASHQEGHLWAALWSLPADAAAALDATGRVLAVHLSGGTTEALHVTGIGCEHEVRPDITIVGATTDISAGQFIDRVGTALGLPFPAGRHLQELAWSVPGAAAPAPEVAPQPPAATQPTPVLRLPLAVEGGRLSFSGPETAAQRAIKAGIDPAQIAWAVFECIAASLELWLAYLAPITQTPNIIMSGGVAASTVLRQMLATSPKLHALRIWWPDPRYSNDNAVGLAAWGAARLSKCPILKLSERNSRQP